MKLAGFGEGQLIDDRLDNYVSPLWLPGFSMETKQKLFQKQNKFAQKGGKWLKL